MLLSLPSLAIFCDFYNAIGECEWHYQPCGRNSSQPMKTCRNLLGIDSSQFPPLEGTKKVINLNLNLRMTYSLTLHTSCLVNGFIRSKILTPFMHECLTTSILC